VEAEDLMAAFRQFVTSTDPYLVLLKAELREITGIDFNNPPPGMPELVADWSTGQGAQSVAFATPILPGKAEAVRTFSREALGALRKQHEESRRSMGLTREMSWINATPMGDMLVVYLEGDDPAKALQRLAASHTPYDRWFKEH